MSLMHDIVQILIDRLVLIMLVAALISLFICLIVIDFATRTGVEAMLSSTGRTAMRDIENPGADWLGRWW